MKKLQEEQRAAINEAKAFLNAAWHTPSRRRYGVLLRWAKELLQPLAEAGVAEAYWLIFALPKKKPTQISNEDFRRSQIEQARVSAKAGSVSAQFFLACELDNDSTVKESAELFKAAAEQGHTYAKWCYGLNLLSGRGVEKDRALGLQFIEDAANEKFEGAIQFLSHAYASATYGYPKNEELAAIWWAKLKDKDIIHY